MDFNTDNNILELFNNSINKISTTKKNLSSSIVDIIPSVNNTIDNNTDDILNKTVTYPISNKIPTNKFFDNYNDDLDLTPPLTILNNSNNKKFFEDSSILSNKKQALGLSSESENDSEVEKYLSKISKKNKKNDTTGGIHSTNVGVYKNQMNLLLGTASYPVNTLSASRFYLKDDAVYDISLTNEMLKIESQELGDGETIFNDVVQLNNSDYIWASKYKPRKPRYFNRVKTGYEWNKYNQVHYDMEVPPPKVIQGYKFNIFYPDLIDKTKAPQYTLERSDTPDTCMIRFHAGPPYEDIAFKIVNREWDMTEKAGFKNLFDRGILYLYLNFKRYRYKR